MIPASTSVPTAFSDCVKDTEVGTGEALEELWGILSTESTEKGFKNTDEVFTVIAVGIWVTTECLNGSVVVVRCPGNVRETKEGAIGT